MNYAAGYGQQSYQALGYSVKALYTPSATLEVVDVNTETVTIDCLIEEISSVAIDCIENSPQANLSITTQIEEALASIMLEGKTYEVAEVKVYTSDNVTFEISLMVEIDGELLEISVVVEEN